MSEAVIIEAREDDFELSDEEEMIPWECKNDKDAEWCLKKIREAKDEFGLWNQFYSDHIETAKKRMESAVGFFESKLRNYFDSVPHHDTKTQSSYDLPSGKLVLKQQDPEYKRDNDKLMEWLQKSKRFDLIKSKSVTTPDWESLKKEVSKFTIKSDGSIVNPDTGEIVDGVTAIFREPKFEIK